jgi:hypothetical protein
MLGVLRRKDLFGLAKVRDNHSLTHPVHLESELRLRRQTGLLQLAAFSFGTIKFWSGFAGDF